MDAAIETQEKRVGVDFSSITTPLEMINPGDAQIICRNIIDILPRKRRGEVTREFIDYLQQKKDEYKTLRSFYAYERGGKRVPKQKEEDLSKVGLSTDNTSESEAILSASLYNSLALTYQLIEQTNPILIDDPDHQKEESYMTLGAKVNVDFTKFFIDINERFGTNEKQLETIFETIFNKSSLKEDLEVRNLKGVKKGIHAAIKAYLYLFKSKSDWNISTPEVSLDRDHGIDLVATNKQSGEINYYQIKGVNEEAVLVQDVTSPDKMEAVRNKLVLSSAKSSRSNLRSLGNLFDYTRISRTQGKKANAYWMEVPV